MLNHLDLCSGIGGFALGLQSTDFFKTIGFCEIDLYCQKVLKKNFPNVPIYNDIKELKPKELNLQPDIITAGFPCQPFSVAGKQKGKDDDRNLWQETFRIIKESKPTFFIGENVSGIVKLYLDTILKDLESEGYSTRCFNISASSIGAKHRRERIWIVSYSNSHTKTKRGECSSDEKTSSSRQHIEGRSNGDGREGCISSTRENSCNVTNSNSRLRGGRGTIGESGIEQERELSTTQEKSECQTQNIWSKTIGCNALSGETENVANTDNIGTQVSTQRQYSSIKLFGSKSQENWWQTFSKFYRIPNGVSYGLDKDRANRIKGLGNAIVPQIPYYIGLAIKEMYE